MDLVDVEYMQGAIDTTAHGFIYPQFLSQMQKYVKLRRGSDQLGKLLPVSAGQNVAICLNC